MNNELFISNTQMSTVFFKGEEQEKLNSIIDKLVIEFNLNPFNWEKDQVREIISGFAIHKSFQDNMPEIKGLLANEDENLYRIAREFADEKNFDVTQFLDEMNKMLKEFSIKS